MRLVEPDRPARHPLRRRSTCLRRAAKRCARCGRASRWCSRTRSPPSIRAPRWPRVLDDPLRIHGLADRRRAARRDRRAARARRARPRACRAARPRDLRRPAPARRHRPRHRHAAGADRARRGGVGARRHRPRRHPGAARRPQAQRKSRPICSSRTISRWLRSFADRIAIMDGGRIVETGAGARPSSPRRNRQPARRWSPPCPDCAFGESMQ